MTRKRARHIFVILVIAAVFIGAGSMVTTPPSFLVGLWHGLLAPWALLARLVTETQMYSCPNPGFGYDIGFLIGVYLSLPVGWVAAIITLLYTLIF